MFLITRSVGYIAFDLILGDIYPDPPHTHFVFGLARYMLCRCLVFLVSSPRNEHAHFRPCCIHLRCRRSPATQIVLFLVLNPRNEHVHFRPCTPNVTNAPMSVGGSSSSAPAPPTRAPGDYWTETPDTWIRMHVIPRFTMFFPPDECLDGPSPDELGPIRVTHLVFSDTTRDTRSQAWRNPQFSKQRTRMKWSGRSVFRKAIASADDSATVENTGFPIKPGTTLALRASLSTLRVDLAEGQRQDPRLMQIISKLFKMAAGAYLAEPRGL